MRRITDNALAVLTKYERVKLVRLIALNVIVNLIDVLSLSLLVLFVGSYTKADINGSTMSVFFGVQEIGITTFISAIFALFVFKSVLGYLSVIWHYRYVYDVASRISQNNLVKYLEGTYSDFVNVDSSVQIRKILHQPIEFCHYVLTGILRGVTETILAVMTVIVIALFNIKLFLLLATVLIPPVFVIAWLTKKQLKRARENVKTSGEQTLQYLQESLSGFIESNIYDRRDFFADRYSKSQKQMGRFLADLETSQSIPSRLIEAFAMGGVLIIILSSKFSGVAPGTDIVNISAFMAAAYKIIPGIVRISNITGQIKTYEYTVNDLVQLNTVEKAGTKHSPASLGSVKFCDVSFSHHTEATLNSCNFSIRKGDFIGITGPSGKGKTTLLNLLLGFLSPHSGEIQVNETTANTSQLQAFWKNISYVQQRPFFLHDTIYSNITLNAEAGNEEHVTTLLDIVGLEELAKRSEHGLKSIITENGKNISGGQRQRIAIARALYKKSDLIILDEPFSELDVLSEQRIMEHLRSLSEGGTMIIIVTHKKENLNYCSSIYELN